MDKFGFGLPINTDPPVQRRNHPFALLYLGLIDPFPSNGPTRGV
jgi:hypothetical protein